jgi:type I restriction enzyme M protein
MTTDTIISRVWSFCTTLRDDGVGYGDYYDYRTNIHHTLKRSPLRLEDLREFITCYNPANRHKRKPTWHPEKTPEGRWRKFSYDELVSRDKTNLDLFWLKDDSLADLDNLPEPADLADEIIDNIEAGLLSFRAVAAALQPTVR